MNILHVFTHLIPTKTLLHLTLHHYPHFANEKRYQGETAQSRSLSGTWWHQHRAATAPRCCSKEAAGASTLLRTALGPQTRFSRCPHSRDTAASCERSFCECPRSTTTPSRWRPHKQGLAGAWGRMNRRSERVEVRLLERTRARFRLRPLLLSPGGRLSDLFPNRLRSETAGLCPCRMLPRPPDPRPWLQGWQPSLPGSRAPCHTQKGASCPSARPPSLLDHKQKLQPGGVRDWPTSPCWGTASGCPRSTGNLSMLKLFLKGQVKQEPSHVCRGTDGRNSVPSQALTRDPGQPGGVTRVSLRAPQGGQR